MTLATIKGRLQTKLASYIILAAVTAVFIWMHGWHYLSLFTVAVVVGLILETIWGYFIDHEPGWLTFTLAGVEFMAIAAIASVFNIPIALPDAVRYYAISWLLIQILFIYFVPILRLKWTTDGSELW